MRSIPDPGFAGDLGEAAPGVSQALSEYADGRGSAVSVLSSLQSARLLVPVVAIAGEIEMDASGLAHDKTSDMAAVLMTGADGRLALLAFTSLAALHAWNPDARPVPVTTQDAAQAAIAEGAVALVVDLAGPVRFVIEDEDLTGVASGWQLARVGDRTAWIAGG